MIDGIDLADNAIVAPAHGRARGRVDGTRR
jgi:hypothetical protein